MKRRCERAADEVTIVAAVMEALEGQSKACIECILLTKGGERERGVCGSGNGCIK